MNAYRSYMDRAKLSGQAHARLMDALESGEKPARRRPYAARCGAMAACLALICLAGWGIWRNAPTVGGDVTPPPVTAATPTASPAATDTPKGIPSLPDDGYVLSPKEDIQGDGAVTPVNFEGGMELCASIAMPDGWFEEKLTRAQIVALLGGGNDAPGLLSWGGCDVTGKAVYDGTGKLWRVALWGVERSDGENSFTMTLRPGALPEDCVVENTEATVLNGAIVNGSKGQYSLDGGSVMGEVRKLTFLSGEVGVAVQVSNRDGMRAELLASLVANCYAGKSSAPFALSLAGLDPYDGEIPAWRSENVTLAEARTVENLGEHLPLDIAIPGGFTFEWGWRELGRGRSWVSASWRATDGSYDYIEVTAYGIYPKADSDEKPIPAGEVTVERITERMNYVDNDAGDFPGWRGRFAVACEDGVTVEYSLKGVTPEEAVLLTAAFIGNQPMQEAGFDARYPTTAVPLSGVDFASYQNELGEEDWRALSAFFPVLVEGRSVMAAHLPGSGEAPVSLKEQHLGDVFSSLENPPAEFPLSSFTLCDVTGDGQKELALYSNHYAGWNYVLHREGDAFYGVYMPIRWFEGLQENGVFWGSGGAATSDYQRLYFEDGAVGVELLGNTDWGYFAIDGKEVDETEFEAWLGELLVGEVPWHAARAVEK